MVICSPLLYQEECTSCPNMFLVWCMMSSGAIENSNLIQDTNQAVHNHAPPKQHKNVYMCELSVILWTCILGGVYKKLPKLSFNLALGVHKNPPQFKGFLVAGKHRIQHTLQKNRQFFSTLSNHMTWKLITLWEFGSHVLENMA